MTEENNVFSNINAGKDRITSTIKKTAGNYLPYILLGVIIVCRVLLGIFQTNIVNPFTPLFFLETIISVALTVFCYVVFIPQGQQNKMDTSLSYKSNRTRWGELSGRIRAGGLLDAFRKYCNKQLEMEREEIKRVIITNNTAFTFQEYIERFSKLNKKELKKLHKKGGVARGEYRAIKKCNGKIKVKPINSVLILSGVAKVNYNDAGRNDSNFVLKWLAKKPLFTVFFAIVVRGISGTYVGINLSVVYGMVLDTISIIMASFAGYGAGEQAICDREDKIKNRILYIESFLEEKNSK